MPRYTELTLLLSAFAASVSGLGINCRGSGLCPFASFENSAPVSVMQGLRDGIKSTTFPDSTTYNSGDHVICVSSSAKITVDASVDQELGESGTSASLGLSTSGQIGSGGVCVFPQNLAQPITLGEIKSLADALLEHGCTTCGSVPVHFVDQGSNDPGQGILTFNFVSNPDCVGNCISAANQPRRAGLDVGLGIR